MSELVGTLDYWETRWKEKRTGWQLSQVNPALKLHLNKLLNVTGTSSNPASSQSEDQLSVVNVNASISKKIFIPLCGQTYDISYLYKMGHRIFGIEGVKDAIDGLNERDQLGLTFDSDSSTFSSSDGRIVIYIGNMFTCPIEKFGPMDCIWDRGSFVAINYAQRQLYVDILKRALRKQDHNYVDFRMLLEVLQYEKKLYTGPPMSVDETDMNQYFGNWANWESIESIGAISESIRKQGVPAEFRLIIRCLRMGSTGNIDYWATRWKEQRTGWQLSKVNPALTLHLNSLLSSPSASSNSAFSYSNDESLLGNNNNAFSKKIFVPLCGQTYDISYLYKLGHRIFGIEGVKSAIDDLNERDQLGLTFDPDTSTYSSSDGRIVIYAGDMFTCPIEKWGPMDCIWDRASLIAVNYNHRDLYMDIIKRSLKTEDNNFVDFKILLEAVRYEKELYPGPPRSVSEMDMEKYFGGWANWKLIESVGTILEGYRELLPEDLPVKLVHYIITPKHHLS